jgi:hypothetical protein
MKTLEGTFKINNLEQVLIDCEFDNEDCLEIMEREKKHIPLIVAYNHFERGQSIYLTFSEGDKGYCILSNCNDEEIVNSTLENLVSQIEEL